MTVRKKISLSIAMTFIMCTLRMEPSSGTEKDFYQDTKRPTPSFVILDKNYQDPEQFSTIQGPQTIKIKTRKRSELDNKLNIDENGRVTLTLEGKPIVDSLNKADLVTAFGAPKQTKTIAPEFVILTDTGTSVRLQAFVRGEHVWRYRILSGNTKSDWTVISTEKTSTTNSGESAKPQLRDWCIRMDLNVPRPNPNICVLYQEPPRGSFRPGLRPRASLRRPGTTNIVAVLNIDENGKIYFNPPGYLYGPIPALKDLTLAQADELWSQSWPNQDQSGNSRTYTLDAPNSHGPVFLDVVFENEKCKRMRVKSTWLNSDWIDTQ